MAYTKMDPEFKEVWVQAEERLKKGLAAYSFWYLHLWD